MSECVLVCVCGRVCAISSDERLYPVQQCTGNFLWGFVYIKYQIYSPTFTHVYTYRTYSHHSYAIFRPRHDDVTRDSCGIPIWTGMTEITLGCTLIIGPSAASICTLVLLEDNYNMQLPL